MKKFWKWKNQAAETAPAERTLFLNGTIAEESWFDDDITPQLFKEELMAGSGDITVWINSPGGDCVAAAQIYNMLMDYKGNVTVKIDGIAASAASVIAMAGTKVLVSPVSMMMIHNPMTVAMGDTAEMQKAIEMLGQSVGGGQGVAAAGENLLAAHTGLQLLAEGARPGVHPDGGVAQGPALLVQGDGAPALAVDAHACHLAGGHGAAFPQPPEGLAHGLPPLLWVLLRPARLGVEHRVAFGGLGQHAALQVEGSHLAGGGAHVNA